MGYYVIMGKDQEGSLPRRREVRPAHLARLTALEESGRLLLAGPLPVTDQEDPGEAGFSGSLIVAAFASLEEARRWADEDPYVAAGVYRSVEVSRFKKVFPGG